LTGVPGRDKVLKDLTDMIEIRESGDRPMIASPERRADRHRRLQPQGEVDLAAIEQAVRDILVALGEDPDRDGLRDTPRRVARSYTELFRGLHESPAGHLDRVFQHEHDDVVILRDIEFFSLCEHHLLPFTGKAHVAYLPGNGQIVGLSKLARTVEVFARRPQVQERLTNQIADAIDEYLQPQAVAVLIEAEHFCMKMRGVNKSSSVMVTSALRGVFRDDFAQGAEVLNLILNSRQ
jgi:GTP cyclohydrolase I